MPSLVIAVIEEPNYANDVLMAWTQVGVKSATLLESTGMESLRRAGLLRDDLPLMPSLGNLEQPQELRNVTLLAVVSDTVDLDTVIAATESIIGSLSDQNTGILFVLPVLRVVGGQV